MAQEKPMTKRTEGSGETEDNWKHRSKGMRCMTCVYFVTKVPIEETRAGNLGRCRRHAPTLHGMVGWPAVFNTDWCGDHKLDENKI